jgi:hypothetical protein
MIQMIPGLERRLMTSSEEEVVFIADLVSALFVVQHGLTRCTDQEGRFEREVR